MSDNLMTSAIWDDEEIYFVYEELKEYLPNLIFEEYSFCSGLLTIKN